MCIHCAIIDLQEVARGRPTCLEFQNDMNQKALSDATDTILDLRKKLEVATESLKEKERQRRENQLR